MDKEKIKKEYLEYACYYKQLQKEIFDLLYKIIDKKKYKNIDISEVKQRPRNKIKSIKSIYENINCPNKYNSCNSLFDIKDIAGIRVICHCEDDLSAFSEIIENKLNEERYLDIKREDKGGVEQKSSNKKSRPSYRAIHITFAKKILHNHQKIKIYCEIQLRTVMGDAWAIQDRKYIYGQNIPEGDRHVLTDSVSEIMKGCEGLWGLVKKKYNDGLEVSTEKFKTTRKTMRVKAKILTQEDPNKFNSEIKKDNL